MVSKFNKYAEIFYFYKFNNSKIISKPSSEEPNESSSEESDESSKILFNNSSTIFFNISERSNKALFVKIVSISRKIFASSSGFDKLLFKIFLKISKISCKAFSAGDWVVELSGAGVETPLLGELFGGKDDTVVAE